MPFAGGFNLAEGLDLLALCSIVEGSTELPQPPGWTMMFDSPVIPPFTEKWQLWQNASGSYAIVVRGTVYDPGSILEDLLAFLAQAAGSVTVGPYRIDYKFAADPHASVNVGFMLGALLLLKDPVNGILAQLAAKVPAGSQIYVTGHSQGAAVATLLRSYFQYAADSPRDKNYSYKTYVYAQPKPGNDHYACDFENLFSNPGLAFRVTNSLDWVPQVPFTIQIPSDINTPNPLSALTTLSSMILTTLTGIGTEARRLIIDRSKLSLRPKAAVLAQVVTHAGVVAPELLVTGFDVPIAPSLNFVNAATEIALIGIPCVGDECKDIFFEHHTATYYALLKAQFPQV
jgi:hypothetical protein